MPEAAPAPGAAAPPPAGATPVLEVREVTKEFGAFTALDGVSLSLQPGQALGLVGPNGSGKTTLINVMSGVHAATRGRVLLRGEEITGLAPHRVCRRGMNRTFQIPRPLGPLTAEENVAVARRHGRPSRHLDVDPLGFVGLEKFASRPASGLTTGQQKRLDLARAIATGPEVLLVDELGAGLSPAELEHVGELLRGLSAMGVALVVVEHLLGFLEAVVASVVVLDAGRPLFVGSLRDAVADPRVIEVFLGK